MSAPIFSRVLRASAFLSLTLALPTLSPASTTNLALGKPATQSSTLTGYPAANASAAVDGNTDGSFYDGSVTHTNFDLNAWWQVDLGASTPIAAIVLWNRTDCCQSRLSDYWVFVSDSPFAPTDTPVTLQNRAATWSSHQASAPTPVAAISTPGVQGRYLRVQLSGANNLSLAEVEVLGAAASSTNLALGKSAAQSSNLADYTIGAASAAVDGSTDGNFFDGSVTHTNFDPNAWWQVDLGASASISAVVLWGRTDCCADRLADYWIFISDTPFTSADTPSTLQVRPNTWSTHQTVIPSPSVTVASAGAQGRYVRVQLSGANNLSLAEVQVMGAASSSSSNLALARSATQSSVLTGYPAANASAAIDGNTDGNFYDGSVTHTNFDSNAWWQVDLGASSALASVIIWGRTDCCAGRLSDYWVFVSDTPFASTDTPATLSTRPGTWSSHQTSAPNPFAVIPAAGAQGRYLRIQLSGVNYLSLAEVQILGATPSAGPHSVVLSWQPSISPNILGYNVYRGTVGGGPYVPYAILVPGTSFTDTSVQSGQTYYYVVTAMDWTLAESVYSNEARAPIPIP